MADGSPFFTQSTSRAGAPAARPPAPTGDLDRDQRAAPRTGRRRAEAERPARWNPRPGLAPAPAAGRRAQGLEGGQPAAGPLLPAGRRVAGPGPHRVSGEHRPGGGRKRRGLLRQRVCPWRVHRPLRPPARPLQRRAATLRPAGRAPAPAAGPVAREADRLPRSRCHLPHARTRSFMATAPAAEKPPVFEVATPSRSPPPARPSTPTPSRPWPGISTSRPAARSGWSTPVAAVRPAHRGASASTT